VVLNWTGTERDPTLSDDTPDVRLFGADHVRLSEHRPLLLATEM